LAARWAARCPYDEDAVYARIRLARTHGQEDIASGLYREFSELSEASTQSKLANANTAQSELTEVALWARLRLLALIAIFLPDNLPATREP
jgi:hypothetical protein